MYIKQLAKICIHIIGLSCILLACQQDGKNLEINDQATGPIFSKVSPALSGVQFKNQIKENDRFNYIYYDGFYQGAGLAVGDLNNDGLQDLFFVGNMTPDKLYLNKGDFKFEDISVQAGVANAKGWSTGASIADVNGDGWQDIYVCRFLRTEPEKRKNLLYINNGDLSFTEQADAYGVADPGYSIQSAFFDYDKDGDLDLYVCNQPPNNIDLKKQLKGKIDYAYTDRMYRNDGSRFVDVSQEAGIVNYTFSLSATIADLNNDNYDDIYVACDYEEPDMLYINNGDGTFTNKANTALKHMSNFSMGVDIADINNDGQLDIYVADMVAADNKRLKTNMSGMNPKKFWGLVEAGYHHQYMFNALQLNNGNGTFSEIAQLSGVSNTDWSWSAIFSDLDHDTYNDLFVTNGLFRDMRDNDFNKKKKKEYMEAKLKEAEAKGIKTMTVSPLEILNLAPSVKLENYVFANNGDLTFEDKTKDWGFAHKGWSHGSAIADLDNDGDMDIIINNMNEIATIYQNQTSDQRRGNYIQVDCRISNSENPRYAIGAKVKLKHEDGSQQIAHLSPSKGYMSGSQAIVHIGVGAVQRIQELWVDWPNGKRTILNDVEANQKLLLYQSEASASIRSEQVKTLFSQGNQLQHQSKENKFDDYEREILLPYKLSRLGPCMASGDVDGDGNEDVYIGGAAGYAGTLYLQGSDGNLKKAASQAWSAHSKSEDVGAMFFDADKDGDLDLYVSSGGNEFNPKDPLLQDRLYFNEGGKFVHKTNALPTMLSSSAKPSAGDIDGDGDLDLFIGGRQVPGNYGYVPQSYLLENDKGIFKDVTESKAEGLREIGMVTDATWLDYDKDEDQDLIIVGEWMPITYFKNDGGSLSNHTSMAGLQDTKGWWNTITKHDMDKDGDMDLVAGNLGLNLKYKASKEQPFKLFVKDFDNNGTHDVYLGYYDSDGVCYPVRGRQCSSEQMPFIQEKFPTYNDFGVATIEQVLGDRMKDAVMQEATKFHSVYIENDNGEFKITDLPNEAQLAPTFGIAANDWNADGHTDLLLGGNFHHREVETTRSDAGTGCLLLGDSAGNFKAVPSIESGFFANKDLRDLKALKSKKHGLMILAANNDDEVQVFIKSK